MRLNNVFFKIYLPEWILIASCCFLFPAFCHAQKISARIIDLPGSFNRDLLQLSRDDDGFIWFGTNEGVWRFDGNDVKLLDYRNLKLQQHTAPFLLYCYGKYLFFCLFNGEVRLYNKTTGECLMYRLPGWVTSVSSMPEGELSFFTNDGQSWKFSPQKLLYRSYHLKALRGWDKEMDVYRTSADEKGNVYVFLQNRAGLVSNDSIRWGPAANLNTEGVKPRFVMVKNVAITSRYLAAVYRDGDLIVYDRHTLSPLFVSPDQPASYCFTENDNIVVIGNGRHKLTGSTPSPYFSVEDILPQQNFDIFTIVPSVERNSFLLGTSIGIVELTVHDKGTYIYGMQQKMVSFFSNKSIRSIYSTNDKFYVGTYTGFYECSADSIRYVSPSVVYAIKPIDGQRLLLAIEGGPGYAILNMQTGVYTDFPKEPTAPDLYTTALYKNGNSWISGDYFALRRLAEKKGNWQIQELQWGQLEGPVRQISRIGGDLFVATQSGFFHVTNENRLQKLYPIKDALRVYCMLGTKDGIWLGTHGNGLVKIDQSGKVLQQLGLDEGLASNFVYSAALSCNLLVAGTGRGVSLFDLSAGALPLPARKEDYFYGNSAQECNHSAIFYDSTLDRVILGGVNGLIFVDGKDYDDARARNNDRVLLSYAKTGGHETHSSRANLFAYTAPGIVLNPKDVSLVLKFAAPGNPHHQDGMFRIVGLDDKWQRIKLNQEVNLYALPPGEYTLQARLPSEVDPGRWFSQPLIVKPAFYQTFFFKAILVAVFLSFIYFLWRSKARKIEREDRLRSVIASDLHDDIGSTLNSISVYTEIARQQLRTGEEKTQALLEKMGIASRNMIDRMSDIVWAIHPRNDHFENVVKRMRFFAGELLSGKNILLKFIADEKIRKLKFTMQERKNIYLIYKEAVNNAYKYSMAGTVTVTLHKREGWVTLEIADDGIGFDAEEKSNSGNGLSNMKARAKEIGGRLKIEEAPSGGTRICLQLRRL